MLTSYETWPFLPIGAHAPEHSAQWWELCYEPAPAIEAFVDAPGSAVIYGPPGSGKSVAQAALRRAYDDVLFVPYLPLNWPSGKRPWRPGRSHVGQIMAAAANEIIRHLDERPNDLKRCHPLLLDYFYWLTAKNLGYRRLARFGHALKREKEISFAIPAEIEIEDIYPNDENTVDVRGQVDELVELAQTLGYRQIIVQVDLNEQEASALLNDLRRLFRLDMLENPGFALRVALPQSVMAHADVEARAGGRLRLLPLSYTPEALEHLVTRCIRAATAGRWNQRTDAADLPAWEQARQTILDLYSAETPMGWVCWVETFLRLQTKPGESSATPDDATAEFFRRHVPLRLDGIQQGVWRGPQFVPLDKQPFEIMKKLFELRGRSVPDALVDTAGSPANLNTLTSRLRQSIEPVKKHNVYIHNRRDLGYWLENFVG